MKLRSKILLGLLLLCCLVWAGFTTFALFYGNPAPLPFKGHRCYFVPKEMHNLVVDNLNPYLTEMKTFEIGPTVQTVLGGDVVIMHFKDGYEKNLPKEAGGAISLNVNNPLLEAMNWWRVFEENGYMVEIENITLKDNHTIYNNHLVVVKTNGLPWEVVFLQTPLLDMPTPKFIERWSIDF